MKPPRFDLLIAEDPREALDCLATNGDEAKLMAGGQSLMAMLNMRLVTPGIVVDISRLSDFDYIRRDERTVEIGATTTQARLLRWPDLAATVPLLAQALPHVGHFQTRNRGTVCGSLAHADPSSELPLVLAVLDGEIVLRGKRSQRVLAAGEFQTGMLSTARRPDEMVVAARFPVADPGTGFAFLEISRRHGDFAIVSLAAKVTKDSTRLGVGGVADRPAVQTFDGLDDSLLDDALNAFAWELGAVDDIHATARYRREMVRRLGRKLIKEARHAATG